MAQTQLEKCFETVINIFHQYSVRVGHFDTLTKGELRQLIEKELPTFLKEQKNPQAIEKIFTDLDKNKDKQISFGEFMDLVVKVVIAAHEHIHKEGDDGHAHHHHH
ncbi:hypothetical protein EYD10_17669 [Varanus komodoensis]|uniref:Protein S100 n=1 Tax=Varanus komodoensis TaxID=61221 RepID=A0A8D2J3I7_VARKO|nr:protein S100-A12-like [Varanus komodoensis]KAF7235505.1 hypothetical protein EYD10_17669 [Varanus komodoensis]